MTLVAKKTEVPVKVELGVTVKKEEVSKPSTDILEEFKPKSALDRIKRAEQFEILSTRYQQLSDKKTSLDKFLISDDGTQGATLILKSGGKTFEISNNGVIKEVLIYAKTKLNSLLEITEAEVIGFTI